MKATRKLLKYRLVSDTLQRRNVMFEEWLSAPVAHFAGRRMGDAWLERNRGAISLLDQVEVLRWDQALAHDGTIPAMLRLRDIDGRGEVFSKALDQTISRFWSRQRGDGVYDEAERFEAFGGHSRSFLLEELAVFTWLCRSDGVDAYAGSWLVDCFEALAGEAGEEFAAFKKPWLQVDYTRNKSLVGLSSIVSDQGIAA